MFALMFDCHFTVQGSTLRKNFIGPAGLVTITFTSPEVFLLALKIDANFCFNINNKKFK